jgi:hypothetical protein
VSQKALEGSMRIKHHMAISVGRELMEEGKELDTQVGMEAYNEA